MKILNSLRTISFLVTACCAAGVQSAWGDFVLTDIGNPAVTGLVSQVSGGFDLTASGSDIGATNTDQCSFDYVQRTNDFDVKVRLAGMSLSDSWAKAALMARGDLTPGSFYAASVATPDVSGCLFQYRAITNPIPATIMGSFPVTYPNTWLRLQRVGNTFTGYAGLDGNTWSTLGSVALSLPATVYVGLAAASRNASQTTVVQVRDFQTVTGGTVASITLPREPLGPSSRRTGLAISEIMYHPRTIPGFSNSLEFIEIFNSQAFFENISGYRISGSVDYTFPANTVMQSGSYLVIARDPVAVQNYYHITGVLGPWNGAETNSLPGGSGTVRLRNRAGAVMLEVPYVGGNPWPIAADGAGHSLVLSRPSYGEGDARAWSASDTIDGSPGQAEPFGMEPLRNVVINEFLAHTEPDASALNDYVELYNHSAQAVDISGAILSDEAGVAKFHIPAGTILPAHGFTNYSEGTMGFALSAGGERIYLINPSGTRVIDAVDYDNQANGRSTGRVPDGSPYFYPLAQRTPGLPNGTRWMSPVVINELMYSPITGNDDDEYVELYNRSTNTVDLSEWRLADGISFNFPTNTMLAPDHYLVIAKNVTNLIAHYPGVLNSANTLGNYSGKLANGGERVALNMPDLWVTTNGMGGFETNTIHVLACDVTYDTGGRWGNWAAGGGSSLELVDPNADTRQAANWADSDETAKAANLWTNIEFAGPLGESLGGTINDRLLIFMLGIGECLVDEVEVRNGVGVSAGPNLVVNPGFESGMASWVPQGSHDFSTIENVGYAGSKSLHLRAASRGDNGENRIRTDPFVGSALVTSPVTFRAKARWVRGWPEVLLRIHGGTAEAVGRLSVPTNLGTPGQRNSRAVTNAGPAIYDVSHSPALPQASEPVVVTAKANDPNGLGALRLRYRVDAGNLTITPGLFTTANMVDDGTGPDAIAGDGIYSASIPGQPTNTIVTFYIEAVDSLGATNLFPQDVFPQQGFDRGFPNDAPSRECVVRWGEIQMPGSFATYHLWLSFATSNRWAWRSQNPQVAPNKSGLDNAELDGTFVYNNSRIVYNALPLYAGSPWHRGAMETGPCGANRVDFVMNFPTDDRMLGATDFVLNNPGNPGTPNAQSTSDTSAQTEQTSYIIFRELGLVYNHRRYIHYFINGNQRSTTGQRTGNFIFEDSQQPNADMVNEWFPDDTNGELYKIEDWFEFPDNGYDFSNNNDADLTRRSILLNNQQTLVITPYRFMFRKRSVGPGDNTADYSKFFSLIDAVSPASNPNSTTVDPAAMNSVADYDQWMRIMAVQHAVGNWDSYGYRRGKNDYTYKPEHGTFQQMTWDIDFTMGVGGDGTSQTIFDTNDPRVGAMWQTAGIVRSYYRAFLDIVNGPMNNSFMDPILDAKQAALLANNISVDPATVANNIKPYITGRRAFLLGLLGPATPAFNINGTNSFSVSNNLLTISGVASVAIRDIAVNGVIYPVTWGGTQTAPTAWTVRIALDAGTNQLVVEGLAPNGTVVAGASKSLTVNYTGPTARPEQSIVFNEIMYNPAIPNTSYVELYDNSDFSFDVSGWRINGLDYTFPRGSVIAGRGFLTLAKNRTALINAYSGSNGVLQVFGEFPGNLDPDGETLTLIKPGATPAQDLIVSKVRYEPTAPWPASANGLGTALQLIDPSQDPARVGNWGDGSGWRYFSISGNLGGSASLLGTNLLIFVNLAGEAYVDDVSLVPLTGPFAGSNLVVNGDFETLPLRDTWLVPTSMTNSDVSTTFAHAGSYSLHVVNTSAGSPSVSIRQSLAPVMANPLLFTNVFCTLSFWYHTTTSTNLTVRTFAGSALQGVVKQTPLGATPSATNATLASIPLIPPLWLNEVQPSNATGPTDGFGERDPWIELYNSGTNALSLDGYYLADNYTNLPQWVFPTGKTINPGQFIVVWADGQPEQSTTTEWHTSFRLDNSTGSVALARQVDGALQLVDYLNYSGLTADQAYGDFPDGQPFERGKLAPTPATNNVPRPVYVKINEWVASNQAGPGGYPDPADNKYDDWFELYNADLINPADISGFYLTDTSANPLQFHIPKGTIIPAGGFLLVWADNDTGENGSGTSGDLHANFNLNKGGEAIGLYAAYGTNIVQLDYITFAGQTTDVSEGRYPDGSDNISRPLTTPTPRAANIGSGAVNHAPTLTAIANGSLILGQTLSFTASATDPDVGQIISYSLLPGFPAGASINSSSGLFHWTPTAGQAPSVNSITVRATDNGSPVMSDSKSFSVTVSLPPKITITQSGANVSLTFATVVGKHYQVQYKTNLNPGPWTPLPLPPSGALSFQATDTSKIVIDTPGGTRFYRIVALD